MDKVTPWIWCDDNAKEMAEYYAALIPDSRVGEITYGLVENPGGGKPGDVLTVELILAGRTYYLLQGGPYFKHTEAFSITILCDDQAELDRYWAALSAHPESEQCGWAKDKFGLSWQVVPRRLNELIEGPDRERAKRATEAMLRMKKLNIAEIEAA